MPEALKPNTSTIKIIYPDREAYNLSSVLQAPRQVTRQDLEAAVANLQIDYPLDICRSIIRSIWPVIFTGRCL